jgi:hypothetical protein
VTAEAEKKLATDADARLRNVMSWVAVVSTAVFATAMFAIVIWRGLHEEAWLPIAKAHFAAVVGLPLVAIAALFVVLILRMASGPIEVEIGSFKFKGAAAPIVFWIMCFLAMSTALRILWTAN